jgi:hypothetical protein
MASTGASHRGDIGSDRTFCSHARHLHDLQTEKTGYSRGQYASAQDEK